MIPDGFAERAATEDDAAEAAALLRALDLAHLAEPTDEASEGDVRTWFGGYELPSDSLVLTEVGTGRLAAVGLLETRASILELDGYVHPDLAGRGLGGRLAGWAEAQAGSRGLGAVRTAYLASDEAAARLFEARGYAYVRTFYRMVVDLAAPPPPPEWPRGIGVSARSPGEEASFHAVLQESFAEHWGNVPRPLDEWLERMERGSDDRSLWLLVREGTEPVAAAVCSQSYGIGWIAVFGVRAAWRRRGIGQALLLHAFGELHRRGESRIGLGVDASNETGAIRLYESVGMRVAWRADLCERPISG